MNDLITLGGIACATLLLSYVRPGRFGVVVLALGVGYITALQWTDALTTLIVLHTPLQAWPVATYAALVLLPGCVALLLARAQRSIVPRVIAACLLAVFVVLLLSPVLLSEAGTPPAVYAGIERYREIGITVLLVLGLADALLSRAPRAVKHSKD